MVLILILTINRKTFMLIIECYENSKINYQDKFTKLCCKALCGSYLRLAVVNSIKKKQIKCLFDIITFKYLTFYYSYQT